MAGFPSRRYHAIMLVLIALTVVVTFQVVGTLLVFGMLLAPAAAGALLAHRIGIDDGHRRPSSAPSARTSGCSSATGSTSPRAPPWCSSRWPSSSSSSCSRPGATRGRRQGRGTRRSRTRRRPIGEPSGGGAPVGDLIVARGLAVGYRGDVVVGGIDVRVAPGASLALVGTNGSGKSTLLKTLVGLQPRLGGELAVLGADAGSVARDGSATWPSSTPRASSCRCAPSTSCAWPASRAWACWAAPRRTTTTSSPGPWRRWV